MKLNMPEKMMILFKIAHTSVAVAFLAVVGLYVYEQKVLTFEDFTNVYAAIPAKSEFEGNESIGLYIFSDNTKEITINSTQVLMCDQGDGNGFGFVSSQTSEIILTPKNVTISVNAKEIADIHNYEKSSVEIASELRSVMHEGAVADYVIYNGNIPTQTGQCYTNFKFVAKTPNFKIEKTYEVKSHMFDYSWYYKIKRDYGYDKYDINNFNGFDE